MSLHKSLKVEVLKSGREYRLLEDFFVYSNRIRGDIVVPKGFVTDFASVPRFFWRLFPPGGRYTPAAVVHDYLYVTGTYPRETCDAIFYDLMERLGVWWITRRCMYTAVKIFGGRAWDKRREQIK